MQKKAKAHGMYTLPWLHFLPIARTLRSSSAAGTANVMTAVAAMVTRIAIFILEISRLQLDEEKGVWIFPSLFQIKEEKWLDYIEETKRLCFTLLLHAFLNMASSNF